MDSYFSKFILFCCFSIFSYHNIANMLHPDYGCVFVYQEASELSWKVSYILYIRFVLEVPFLDPE